MWRYFWGVMWSGSSEKTLIKYCKTKFKEFMSYQYQRIYVISVSSICKFICI
jgi:hypothetical protein